MSTDIPPKQPNTLGNSSLILGILSLSFVFGIGLCALTGTQQNWLQVAANPVIRMRRQQRIPGFAGYNPGCWRAFWG